MILGKYINNISGLRLFNLIRYGVLLLIAISFAKSGLTLAEIGYYEILIFIAGAVSFFWLTGIIQSLLPLYKNNKTFTEDTKELKKSPEFFNAFLLISLFSIIAGLFIVCFNEFISKLLNDSQKIPHLTILVLYVVICGPASLVEYFYLLLKRPDRIVIYGFISFFVHFILVAGPAIAGYGIQYSLWGLIIINIIRLIWLVIILFKYAEFRFSFKFIKEHISLGTPLIVSIFLSGSATYIDGFIIANKFDTTTFTIFRYGAREMPLVILLANAFSTSMIPELRDRNKINESLGKIKKESSRMVRYLFPISILLLITSGVFYPIVFKPEFAESSIIFNIYLLVIVSRLVFPQTILIGLKKTKIILLGSFMEIILNVCLSLFLINIFGIAGVALATVMAFYFEKIFLIIYNYVKLKIPPSKYIPVKLHIIYSVLIIVVFFIIEFHLFQ